MLQTALFDSFPKDIGVNSIQISVKWGKFRFSSMLNFAMVISSAAFSSFMSWFSIKYALIIFILFLLESSYMKT